MSDHETESVALGSGARWLGWQKIDMSVTEFESAIEQAQQSLADLALAKTIKAWLDDDASCLAEDYRDRLMDCEDSIEDALGMTKELEEEAEELWELLEFIDEVPNVIDDELGEETSDRIKDDISNFIAAKLEPVKESGRKLYHVLIHAVNRPGF